MLETENAPEVSRPARAGPVMSPGRLHPRCWLVQRRSIDPSVTQRGQELETGQVAHIDTPYETGHILQFRCGV